MSCWNSYSVSIAWMTLLTSCVHVSLGIQNPSRNSCTPVRSLVAMSPVPSPLGWMV